MRPKPANYWFTPALNKLKLAKRLLERVWSKSHSIEDLKLLRTASNHCHAGIIKAKRVNNSTLIASEALFTYEARRKRREDESPLSGANEAREQMCLSLGR